MKEGRVMNRLKRYLKKNSLIIKILISYFITVVVLLSIFSFTLFRTYSKRNIEEVNRTSENSIFQSYYIANVLLTNIYYNFYQLFDYGMDNDINNGLYVKDIDLFVSVDVLKKLNQYELANPLIRSIYIYNSKADRVIFSISQEGKGIQTTVDFFDQDMIQRLNGTKKSISSVYFTRKVDYVINEKNVSENLMTLVFANITDNRSIESALVINLKQEVFQQMVTSGKSGDLNQVLIMYKNGDILSYSDSSMVDKNLANESFAKKILQSVNEEGNFITKINGKQSIVSYIKAKNLGLIFIGIGEYSKLLSPVYSMRSTLLILTVIFIIAGVIVAAFFTSRIYNPFKRLIQNIQQRSGSQNKNLSLDVFDYLKYTFDEMADDIDKYRLDSNQLLDNKKKTFLKKVVDGDINDKIRDKNYMMECGINFDAPFFLAIVLKADSFENSLSDLWSKDLNLAKFAILNIACELLSDEQFKAEGIDNGSNYVSVLLNLKNRNEEITDILKELQESAEKYLKISVTAGIGDIVEGVDDIVKSFQNAMTALNYKMIFGRKSVIRYCDIAEQNKSGPHEYPYDIEKHIVEAIKGLNMEKIDMCLREFFGTLALYNADEIQITVVQLSVSLTKTLSNIAKTSVENGEYSIKELFSKIQACETLEEIRKYLYSICSDVVLTQGNEPKNNNKITNVNNVRNYVKKYFNDKNISTDLVADYVGLSCNYVRSIYKETTGMSLSDYITKCRMEEAQRLLNQTDYTVGRIAELVGYPENNKHFYTIFKKYFGRTPENYRNERKLS